MVTPRQRSHPTPPHSGAASAGETFRLGDGPNDVQDVEGYYTSLLDASACDALVKRPDYYIFGATHTVQGLGALIAGLGGSSHNSGHELTGRVPRRRGLCQSIQST